MNARQYRFYGCYLLESENADAPKGKSYIGFTVDPARRIRQHNGDLSTGGAKRTKSMRPWRVVCIVHGFRSQVQGLQFEWSWQHPLLSRSVRTSIMEAKIPGCKLTARGRQRECRVESNLRILQTMLSCSPWNVMPLTVTFFDSSFFDKLSCLFPESIKIDQGRDLSSFCGKSNDSLTRSDNLSESNCASCELEFVGSECRVVTCPRCRSFFHARCAASSFLRDEKSLLPTKSGECPICGQSVSWSEFVRSAFIFDEDPAATSSDSDEVIDLDEGDEERQFAVLAKSPVVTVAPSSLRSRLFKKTGNNQLFEI